MAIASNLALLAGAKGRLGKSRVSRVASTPAAVSLCRSVPSPAPLLRLHPLRSAAARCSPAVARVARENTPYTGNTTDEVNLERVTRRIFWIVCLGLVIWIGFLVLKWRKAVLLAAII